ncbi:MAG: A24 family peptidase [Chloroflexota bacterium]
MTLNILWALIGWLVGYVVNQLADFFAELVAVQDAFTESAATADEAGEPTADFEQPDEASVKLSFGRPGMVRFLQGERARKRPFFLELICIAFYAFLPSLIPNTTNLIVNSLYIAILILIMVVDLENKAVFGIVIYPAVLVALLGSFIVTPEENTIGLAVVGAIVGFVIFWGIYKFAQLLYGADSGALGFGDVQIALLMGAMLGLHRVIFALILAMFLGGIISAIVLLVNRNVGRQTALPYGQYLTLAAIIMLIWGAAYYQFYWS